MTVTSTNILPDRPYNGFEQPGLELEKIQSTNTSIVRSGYSLLSLRLTCSHNLFGTVSEFSAASCRAILPPQRWNYRYHSYNRYRYRGDSRWSSRRDSDTQAGSAT